MKKLIHTLILCVLCSLLHAQIYSNEWINFSNKYYKFPIYQKGFYRIDSLALAQSGISLAAINPENFQLFISGKEQIIYVKGEADNVFNKTDFIEFYAEQNDGRFDSTLYYNITYQPNPYVSLLTDTIYGFLTWNNLTNNKRYLIETDTASAMMTPAKYFYTDRINASNENYNFVEEYANGASDPRYTQCEGYGNTIYNGGIYDVPFGNLNPYNAASLPVYLTYAFSGAAVDNSYSMDHEIKCYYTNTVAAQVTLSNNLFKGYKPYKYSFTLSSADLDVSSKFSVASITNPIFAGASGVLTVLHYLYLKYPQIPDLGNASLAKLFVDDDNTNDISSKTYLKLNAVNTGTTGNIIFYDVTNNKRIDSKTNGSFTKILIPNSGGEKICYLGAESNVILIKKLIPVNQNGNFVNYTSIGGDSAFVIITHNSLITSANSYKAYRQSAAGGAHNVILADIDDLYDQFAFGIKKHPLSIRNFCRYLIANLPSRPKYVFLIGKSINNIDLRGGNPTGWTRCLVPTMGNPPSDNLLTSALTNNNTTTPEIPVGRLSALTTTEVASYLSKVTQFESPSPPANDPLDWKKRVLQFGGGTDAGLLTYISQRLDAYGAMNKDTLFGAKVFKFMKTTTAPIQITISDSVKQLINYGASLITFFGHGDLVGFDQAIDDPTAYNNAGKYPFMLALSCYSGNFHYNGIQSSSEKFVLINDKGTIGSIASCSWGFVSELDSYATEFNRALSLTKYNKGIGDVIKEACYQSSAFSGDIIMQLTAQYMSFQGDPSVIVSPGRLPDYFINNSSVSFSVNPNPNYVDSIGIVIDISNLGKAISDTFVVRVERNFPNNDQLVYNKIIKAPLYKDKLMFYMPIDYTRGIGLNKFNVMVDANSAIAELNENNNSTIGTVDYIIQGGDIVPVYPYKYDIIPKTPTVTLKASTSDPFTKTRNYRLQLDTCDAFTDPIQTAFINSAGGVVEWTVNLPFADSTVYYWRVTKDSVGPKDGFVWRESSFQVIGNKHGWGQSHFFQFKSDAYQFVKYKKSLRRFEFENDYADIKIRDGFWPPMSYLDINLYYNYSIIGGNGAFCAWNGWNIAVFDSISTLPWASNTTNTFAPSQGVMGNCVCHLNPQILHTFDFGATNWCSLAGWQNDMRNFLNSVPDNNYILAYSQNNHGSSTYNNALYTEFEKFGSANIRSVKDTTSIIIFGQKGKAIGTAQEVIGTNSLSIITLHDSIQTRWNNGFIASEIIGPSYKWNSLHWKIGTLDVLPGDTTILKVVGIKTNGVRDTLAVFTKDSLNILALYNYVDATIYPTLQLVAFMKDYKYKTSPQLKRWQVLYDEAPECAINPKKGFKVVNDTLQEGDKVTFYLPIENVGTVPFIDSLVFTYWIEDANRILHNLPQKLKSKPFIPGAVILDTVKISSYQYPGNNALWIDINPPQNIKYQKEQYHFNNVARYPFSVSRDQTNPLLDVTFDGVRIMNGDVVSAKPMILISLKDENKFLALNDTSVFNVYLKKPNDIIEQKIFFANGLQFTPAQLPNNSAKINFNPNLLADGKYTLIVQAKDRSNNQSGAIDYRIVFEIVNKPSITQVINYPNPFSTSTRFVFMLTGTEVPEMFNIQIMTITGKLVKTIMKEELGPMHIGRNITQYAWDGKDDFGDRLGNGVYLYKVQTKLNGQDIERQSSGADQYFTKEIGKMVIMH